MEDGKDKSANKAAGNRGISAAKAELRSALHDASRADYAADAPTGLGVRARQRRFPTAPAALSGNPYHPHSFPSRANRIEDVCLTLSSPFSPFLLSPSRSANLHQ